jgi:hypothetical protein
MIKAFFKSVANTSTSSFGFSTVPCTLDSIHYTLHTWRGELDGAVLHVGTIAKIETLCHPGGPSQNFLYRRFRAP